MRWFIMTLALVATMGCEITDVLPGDPLPVTDDRPASEQQPQALPHLNSMVWLPADPNAEPPKTTLAPIKVTYLGLLEEHKRNRHRFKDAYGGKWLQVSGKVSRVTHQVTFESFPHFAWSIDPSLSFDNNSGGVYVASTGADFTAICLLLEKTGGTYRYEDQYLLEACRLPFENVLGNTP